MALQDVFFSNLGPVAVVVVEGLGHIHVDYELVIRGVDHVGE